MGNRYEEVTDHCLELVDSVIETYFPDLYGVKIKFLFDTKKRVKSKRIVLGECKKPNDLAKHFSLPETKDDEGYQYVITLDKLAYENIEDPDRIRIIRHELRHVLVLIEEDDRKYKINPHNIEDFVEEVALNADDPDWARRVGGIARVLYKK